MALPTPRLVLRDLSPATRAVLAVFLLAVGVGYLSALVQLSVQHAKSFGSLPTAADAQQVYAGSQETSQMERLLTASEERPFNGTGQMVEAFTTRSAGWHGFMAEHGGDSEARKLRDAERLAMLDWIKSGCDRKAYDEDRFTPSAKFPEGVKLPDGYLARGPGMSTLERLISTPSEGQPFSGLGSMRPAFFDKSSGWKGLVKKQQAVGPAAVQELMDERGGEADALIAWANARPEEQKTAFENDDFALPAKLAGAKVTPAYLAEAGHVKIQSLIADRCVRCHKDGDRNGALDEYERVAAYTVSEPGGKDSKPLEPTQVKIRTLIADRCVRCHDPVHGTDDRARKAPLDTYERFTAFCDAERTPGMSIRQLAQSTHAHLLAFAMLFAMTGLIFSFTGLPGWVRFLIAPLPLLAQVLEIGCWWLSRVYPEATLGILIGGGVVGASLVTQIGLSLLSMVFGRRSLTNGNGTGGSV